ncbi:MAG: type IX secretion system membrane protein PorP/SprF [Bacteroidetes bacterium]|nr:MAG: type IX secretion system membrane protein PorP/SprF [Bacteroidota bacterium]
MKKQAAFLSVMFSGVLTLPAQQLPLHSQYLWNDYLINPAVAGIKEEESPVFLSYRTQWSGLEGAPVTQMAGMHGAASGKIGLGLLFTNDKTGPIHKSSFQFGYSYRLKIADKCKISFGVAPAILLHSLKKSELTFDQPDAFAEGVAGESAVMDATAGLYFSAEKYFSGFSVPQILENRIWQGDKTTYARLKRHYLLYGGYELEVNEKFTVQPSLYAKYAMGAPVQWDVNVRGTYHRFIWMGFSWRANASSNFNDAMVFMIGVSKLNIHVGYAYDYSFGKIRKSSLGSHEIFISYTISNRIKGSPTREKSYFSSPSAPYKIIPLR